jgi:hypothetical protein
MNMLPQVERLKDLTTASAVIHACRVDALDNLAAKLKELDMSPQETVMLMMGNGLPYHDLEALAMRMGFNAQPVLQQLQRDKDAV